MMLFLDAGNTRLKWGLHDGTRWLERGARAVAASEGLAAGLPARPERILACNVAGAMAERQIEALARGLGAPLDWFRSSAACCGVSNGYDDPQRLGADRWAALIGARSLHPGAALVVMAGTATTIDLLDAAGRFQGGLILPGFDLMRAALARNTAGLPEARGGYRDTPPTNTDDAIVSGALHATLGAIERMARRIAGADFVAPPRSQPLLATPHGGAGVGSGRPSADFQVVLSGGAADALAPHLELPCRCVEHLVLEGLVRAGIGLQQRLVAG